METPKYRASCDTCLIAKIKCSQTKPSCLRCSSQPGQLCVYSQYRRIGRPYKRPQQQQESQQQQSRTKFRQNKQGNGLSVAETGSSHPSEAPAPLPSDEGNGENSKSLDLNLTNSVPTTSAPVLSQGILTASPDRAEVFDFTADMSSFDYDMSASDFVDLGVFDSVPSPPLMLEEGVQNDRNHDVTSQYYQPEPTASSFKRAAPQKHPPKRASFSLGQPNPFTAPFTSSRSRCAFTSNNGYRKIPRYSLLIPPPESAIDPPNRGYSQAFTHDRPGRFLLQSTTADSSCNGRCHAILTEQLSCLSKWLSEECSVLLDSLLNINDHISCERKKVLRCAACLGKTRNRQTLMLIIMVLEKLLCLFERECDVDRLSSALMVSEIEPLAQRQGLGSLQHHKSKRSGGALPARTNLPLVVGSVEVDEIVKTAFVRELLRMHFERQLVTISELDKILTQGTKDVSYKITSELLVDVYRRIEYIQGLLVFS